MKSLPIKNSRAFLRRLSSNLHLTSTRLDKIYMGISTLFHWRSKLGENLVKISKLQLYLDPKNLKWIIFSDHLGSMNWMNCVEAVTEEAQSLASSVVFGNSRKA